MENYISFFKFTSQLIIYAVFLEFFKFSTYLLHNYITRPYIGT